MPTSATQVSTGTYFADALRATTGYARMLVEDIPAERFTHMPHPQMNHPAFCLGHLSIYPDKALGLLGREDLTNEKPGWADLFEHTATCTADGRYPSKDEILGHYMERHEAALRILPEIPDEVFQRENPAEGKLRDLFPTVGAAVNFLLNNHNMLHLGQISAWRRAAGMGPVM